MLNETWCERDQSTLMHQCSQRSRSTTTAWIAPATLTRSLETSVFMLFAFSESNAKLTRNSRAGVCVTKCERSEHHTNDSAWIVEWSFLLGAFRAHQLSYLYTLSFYILAPQTPTERTLYTQRLHDGRWAAFHGLVNLRMEQSFLRIYWTIEFWNHARHSGNER